MQLALKLDGSKLEGRTIRVKRSVKKDKQNKTTGKPVRGSGKSPTKGPVRASGKEKGGGRGGFKSPKTFGGNQARKSSTSFKGETVDPRKKTKKGLKKKRKPKKTVHI